MLNSRIGSFSVLISCINQNNQVHATAAPRCLYWVSLSDWTKQNRTETSCRTLELPALLYICRLFWMFHALQRPMTVT